MVQRRQEKGRKWSFVDVLPFKNKYHKVPWEGDFGETSSSSCSNLGGQNHQEHRSAICLTVDYLLMREVNPDWWNELLREGKGWHFSLFFFFFSCVWENTQVEASYAEKERFEILKHSMRGDCLFLRIRCSSFAGQLISVPLCGTQIKPDAEFKGACAKAFCRYMKHCLSTWGLGLGSVFWTQCMWVELFYLANERYYIYRKNCPTFVLFYKDNCLWLWPSLDIQLFKKIGLLFSKPWSNSSWLW